MGKRKESFSLIFFTLLIFSNGQKDHSDESEEYFAIAKSKAFVDKSLFLKSLFLLPGILQISAPCGFGKTTMMRMVHDFLQAPFDASGKPMPKDAARAFPFFQKLRVYEEKNFFFRHFGRYPVVFLKLVNLTRSTNREFLSRFTELIAAAYEKYSVLESSTCLYDAEKDDIKSYRNKKWVKTPFQLEMSISKLCRMLYLHFMEKCVILIDDFDGLSREVISENRLGAEEGKMIKTMKIFFMEIFKKKNKYVELILATGRIKLGEVYPYAKDIQHLTFTSKEIAPFYGLTFEDFNGLASRFHPKDELKEGLSDWYGGYKVEHSDKILFNTESVIKSLEAGKLKYFWREPRNLKLFKHILFYEAEGKRILNSLEDSDSFMTEPFIPYEDVRSLREMTDLNVVDGSFKGASNRWFYQYLLDCGYYTKISVTEGIADVIVPNKEAKSGLLGALHDSWTYKFGFEESCEKKFIRSVESLSDGENSFKNVLLGIVSFFERFNSCPVGNDEFAAVMFVVLSKNGEKFEPFRGRKDIFDIVLTRKCAAKETNCPPSLSFFMKVEYGSKNSTQALEQMTDLNEISKELASFGKSSEMIKQFALIGLSCETKFSYCEMSYLLNSTDMGLKKSIQYPNH